MYKHTRSRGNESEERNKKKMDENFLCRFGLVFSKGGETSTEKQRKRGKTEE